MIVKGNSNALIENNGTLKIIDSTTEESDEGELTYSSGMLTSSAGKIITNNGTLNIEKAVISSPNIAIENIGTSKILKSKVTGTTSAVLNKETGQAEINKSTIVGAKYALDNSSSDFMKIIDSEVSNTGNWNYCVRNNSSGNIEIEESKISGTYESLAIGGFGSGIITIKSGSIYGDYGAIYNGTATSTINVLGGTFTGYSTTVDNYGILNISNGEIKGSRYETIHNYSGTLNISGGVIDSNTSGYDTIRQDLGTTIVTGGIIKHPTTGGSGINIVSGTLNIEGGTYSSNNTVVNNESGIVNMSNVSIENVPVAVTNNTGTVNINESVTINASDKGIDISGGTLNIGEKGNVSFDDPSITGTNYGVYNTNGKIYFYDGIIKGKQNQSIYGVVTETEPGYKIRKTTENEVESSILEIIGTEERAIVVNGINFIDLQAAINAVPDNTETTMELYSNIILNSDIVIPEGKIINLYYRGYTITKGNYTITNNGTVNVKDEDTSGGILGTIKALLNIEDNNISKNIIVYQMDDGSILSSVEDYTLESLVNGKYEKIDVEEVSDEVGRYNISSNKTNTLMTTINGRIYLNNITSGSYKLVSSSGKEISFEISDEGTLSSNIKENFSLDTNKILSLSTAEIITSIRTGQTVIRFGILISLISVILSLLIIAKRQNEKYL